MNEELLKVRDINGYDGEPNKVRRLDEDSLILYQHDLNFNIATLFFLANANNYDEKEFVHRFIENIYIILSMFNEMNVFPGFFFRKAFEMNAKYYERRKEYDSQPANVHSRTGIRGDYSFYRDTSLGAWLEREMARGIKEGYFHVQAYPKTNISDAFLEILGLFQKNDFPYKVTTKEQCAKIFDDVEHNHSNLSTALLNSDTDDEDVEYLSRLLYEYLSFFVSIGVNPQKYFEEYLKNDAAKTNAEHNKRLAEIRAEKEAKKGSGK